MSASPVCESWSTLVLTSITCPGRSEPGSRSCGFPMRARSTGAAVAQPPSATRTSRVAVNFPCREHSATARTRPPAPERMVKAAQARPLPGVKRNLPFQGTGSLSSVTSMERMK